MADRRRQGFIDGSLAYSFEQPRDVGRDEYAPAKENAEKKAVSRPAAAPAGKQSVAPLTILGCIVAAVLAVFALMNQIELTAVSGEAVALQNRLDELIMEESRLQVSFESAYDLTEIEEYALSELGMQKPAGGQIVYINGGARDRIVIHTGDKESGSKGLSGVRELFAGAAESVVRLFGGEG